MRCKKCEKLIHRLVDGDLNQEEKKNVCAHIETCSHCASYYDDISSMCSALHEPDREPPENFRVQWKQAVAQAAASGQHSTAIRGTVTRKPRLGYIVPAVACGAAAIMIFSSSLGAPKSAPIRQFTSGQNAGATIVAPSDETTQTALPDGGAILFQGVTEPEQAPVVAEQAPEYSEKTTAASNQPGLVTTGNVEEIRTAPSAPVVIMEDETFGDGPADLAPATPYEVQVASESDAKQIRELAAEAGTISVRFDEDLPDQYVMEGPADTIRSILATQGYTIPEGTGTIAIAWGAQEKNE